MLYPQKTEYRLYSQPHITFIKVDSTLALEKSLNQFQRINLILSLGFHSGSEGKAPAWNVGDPGSMAGLGSSPREGNGNPLQYSCLENPMGGGAWLATVHGVAKSRTQLSELTSLHFTYTILMECGRFRDDKMRGLSPGLLPPIVIMMVVVITAMRSTCSSSSWDVQSQPWLYFHFLENSFNIVVSPEGE